MAVDVADTISGATEKLRNRWIGIYIATLAVLLAICAIGADDAAKMATRANIEASNAFAFFQAKNNRQTSLELTGDTLETLLLISPDLPQETRARIETKLTEYRSTAQRYESEPDKGEGKKELLEKARNWEQKRDVALARDPYFDYAQALLQIAIVLASASLIAGGAALFSLSGALGFAGLLLMANGFTLALS